MTDVVAAERRNFPRYDATGLSINLRIKGRLARLCGPVVDFNRFGLAVLLDQPLPKEKQVFITMQLGGHKLDEVVGVVHNCLAMQDGYRCGIQFRTDSKLQFDQDLIELELSGLEQAFSAA